MESLGRGGGAGADGLLGEQGLLADAVGDVARFALVGANRRQVFGAADEVERAQGFPDLLVAGIDDGNFLAGGDAGPRDSGERVETAGDGRAQISRLFAAVAECLSVSTI